MHQGLWLFILSLVALSDVALAQASPEPNGDGDYFSNDGPVLGQVKSPKSPGSLWRVVAPGLNCRQQPGVQTAIVKQFSAGQLLQVNVGRGGSDEVLKNAIAPDGKPWMWVRSPEGQDYDCYVRANQRYIQPLTR